MKLFLLDGGYRVAHTKGEREPKWQMLFPLGAEKHRGDFPNGKATFDAAFLGTMLENFRTAQARYRGAGSFRLQMNYCHPEADEPIDNKVASGWIEDLRLTVDGPEKDRGLYSLTRWTERAVGYIEADELCCLSPEFNFNALSTDTGKRQGPTLFGAALLNTPFLAELPRVAASAVSPAVTAVTAEPAINQEHHVDKKKICALLGIAEDSTDEAVMTALAAHCASAKASKESAELAKKLSAEGQCCESAKKLKAGDCCDAGRKLAQTELRVKLENEANGKALKLAQDAAADNEAKLKKLTATVEALESVRVGAEVDALVTKLMSEGRIVAAQQADVKEYATKLGVGAAAAFYGKFARAVSVGEKGIRGSASVEADENAADAMKKLNAFRDELVKSGLSMSDAMLRVIEQHPDLATASQKATTTN